MAEVIYVIEDNIGLSKLKYDGTKQIVDVYYIVSSEKKPDYALDNNGNEKNWLWLWIVGSVVVGAGVGFLVWWIWGVVERRRYK